MSRKTQPFLTGLFVDETIQMKSPTRFWPFRMVLTRYI